MIANRENEDKKRLCERSRVLLISDMSDDYEALKKYGFKTIDWWRSKKSAEHFFSANPSELEKYDIFIYGRQISAFNGFAPMSFVKRKIWSINETKKILLVDMTDWDKLTWATIMNYKNYARVQIHTLEYEELLDRIVDAALVNGVLENRSQDLEDSNITFNREEPKVEKKALPKRKENLRILYLIPYLRKDKFEDLARKLGLSVDFVDEGNFTWDKRVYNELGNYDIIVGSKSYSWQIPYAAVECSERSKSNGQPLTLLATYEQDSQINLNYAFGGLEIIGCEKKYPMEEKVYFKPSGACAYDLISETEQELELLKIHEVILSTLIDIYDSYRKESGLEPLDTTGLKTRQDFLVEYNVLMEAKREEDLTRKRQEAEIAHLIDKILDIQKSAYIYENWLNKKTDLQVSKIDTGVRIAIFSDLRPLCAITILKESNRDACSFMLETINNRGVFCKPKRLKLCRGYFTYDINTPNEKERDLINAIYRKVNSIVSSKAEKGTSMQYKPMGSNKKS